MDRSAATAYLDATLAGLRDLARVAAGDWDVVVDKALLTLGLTTDGAPTDALAYRCVLDWAGLWFLGKRLGDQVDNGNPEGNARWSQAADRVRLMLPDAAATARVYALAGELATGSGYGVRVAHRHGVLAEAR